MENTKKTIRGIANAARYLNVSRRTIHRYVDKGEFPKPIKVGIGGTTTREWRKKDLDKFAKYFDKNKAQHVPKSYQDKVTKIIEARFREVKSLHVNSGGVKLDQLYKIVVQLDLPELSKERFRQCISELGQQMLIEIRPVYTIDEIKDPGRAIESFCIL